MNEPIDDRLPFAVLMPEAAGQVIDVYEQSAALRIAVVDREAVRFLTDDWDQPGVYILLDRPDPGTGEWGSYVGKAPAGLRSRVKQHVTGKDHWYRAVLIRRDTTFGWTGSHTGWLEGRLYDLLDSSAAATLHNGQRPGDPTLPGYELLTLEASVDPISRLLRLLGHDPSSPDETPTPAGAQKSHHGVTIGHLVSVGLLAVGDRLVGSTAGASADAIIETNPITGAVSIAYDGQHFESPSGAALAARGGGSVNGWEYWAIETATGKVRLSTLRRRFQQTTGIIG